MSSTFYRVVPKVVNAFEATPPSYTTLPYSASPFLSKNGRSKRNRKRGHNRRAETAIFPVVLPQWLFNLRGSGVVDDVCYLEEYQQPSVVRWRRQLRYTFFRRSTSDPISCFSVRRRNGGMSFQDCIGMDTKAANLHHYTIKPNETWTDGRTQ